MEKGTFTNSRWVTGSSGLMRMVKRTAETPLTISASTVSLIFPL